MTSLCQKEGGTALLLLYFVDVCVLTYVGHGALRGGWTAMRAQSVAAFPLEKNKTTHIL